MEVDIAVRGFGLEVRCYTMRFSSSSFGYGVCRPLRQMYAPTEPNRKRGCSPAVAYPDRWKSGVVGRWNSGRMNCGRATAVDRHVRAANRGIKDAMMKSLVVVCTA